jgi:hypothetical protein
VRALESNGSKRLPYFEFRDDMLDDFGNIASVIHRSDRIRYRCPGIRNSFGFDLWCPDALGNPDGCNNWSP